MSRDEAKERFKEELKQQSKAFAGEVKEQSKRFADDVRDTHDQFHAQEHATKPRRRRGKGPRSAEEIVATALWLADSEGFAAVTMRRVAAELGYGTMSLYWYVENRDELVQLMFEEVIHEQLLPEPVPTDWREGLTAIARAAKALHQRHPWMVAERGLRPGPGPNLLRHIEQSLAVTTGLAAHPELRAAAIRTVDEFVLGYLATEVDVGEEEQDVAAWLEQLAPMLEGSAESPGFPRLKEALSDLDMRDYFMADHFEIGLELLLDGVQARLDRAEG